MSTRVHPAMPNAPEFYQPEARPYCTICREETLDLDRCAMPRCHEELCELCRFECPDCGRVFCREHMDACGCSDIRIAKEEEAVA